MRVSLVAERCIRHRRKRLRSVNAVVTQVLTIHFRRRLHQERCDIQELQQRPQAPSKAICSYISCLHRLSPPPSRDKSPLAATALRQMRYPSQHKPERILFCSRRVPRLRDNRSHSIRQHLQMQSQLKASTCLTDYRGIYIFSSLRGQTSSSKAKPHTIRVAAVKFNPRSRANSSFYCALGINVSIDEGEVTASSSGRQAITEVQHRGAYTTHSTGQIHPYPFPCHAYSSTPPACFWWNKTRLAARSRSLIYQLRYR